MFYDIESITRLDSGERNDGKLLGESFNSHFGGGETLTVHNAVIAEFEAEITPGS
jgi:hypothetical protein